MRITFAAAVCLLLPAITAARSLAVRNVTLIDGTGSAPQAGVTVVVDGDRITAVGANVAVPANATIIDGTNRYLIPGLFDAHVHLTKLGSSALKLFIANGVTSVRDMGSDIDEVRAWRRAIDAGARVGPRIRTSGPILESPEKIKELLDEHAVEPVMKLRRGVGDAAQAADAVAMLKASGADYVKVRTFASKETYFAIGEAAKKAGLPLVGHAYDLSPEDLLRSGQRSIEHFLSPTLVASAETERRKQFRALAEAGVVLVPTVVVGRESLFVPYWRANAIVQDGSGRIDARRRYVGEHLLRDWREQVAERAHDDRDWETLSKVVIRNDREMHAEGMCVLAGTDAAVVLIYAGFSLHDELERLVDALGFTSMEALLSATRNPAEFLGMRDAGTIAVGNVADLVLLDANPIESISNTRRIRAVIARGISYDRRALDRLLAEVEAEVKR